jgi:hypothetical protein
MIYFVQSGDSNGPIKIGYVDNETFLPQRLGLLQTGNPEILYAVATMPGDLGIERALHERFVAGRIRGEWFRPDTPGLQEFIYDAVQTEALMACDHRVRFCAWCKTGIVKPPRTKLCSGECERAKKQATSRAWKAARR